MDRIDHPTTCGNHWKYSKLAGDVCVKPRGHIGPHQTTEAREAHTFSWFDDEGIPPEDTTTSADSTAFRAPSPSEYRAAAQAAHEERCGHCRALTEAADARAAATAASVARRDRQQLGLTLDWYRTAAIWALPVEAPRG
jgi:hypothetical protein